MCWTDSWTCCDPGGLVADYARLFQACGGRFENGDATTLQSKGAGWSVSTQSGRIEAEHAVVALGPWVPSFCAVSVTVFRWSTSAATTGILQTTAVLRSHCTTPAMGWSCRPMDAGVRVATGAELALPDAPGSPRQLDLAVAGARQLTNLGDPVEAEAWMGRPPLLPRHVTLRRPAIEAPYILGQFRPRASRLHPGPDHGTAAR